MSEQIERTAEDLERFTTDMHRIELLKLSQANKTLRAQRDRLRECLRDFMALLDQGVLVRNTEHDADYGKFFNQATRIAAVLKAAQIALESDSIDHARQAKTE